MEEKTRTIIIAYGNNENARKEEKNAFFENIQNEIDDEVDYGRFEWMS